MISTLAKILKEIKPTKLTCVKTDRIMLHVEPMKDGELRVTYSNGFVRLNKIRDII